MTIEVDQEQVADFGFYLGTEASFTLPRIEQLAREEGMSDHGFGELPCVLAPLGDIVNGAASVLVGEGFSLMQRKLCDLGDGVINAAKKYGYIDEGNASLFERNGLAGDTGEEITQGSGYGPGDGYDRHGHDGSSTFKYADLEISPIDRPDANFTDEIDAGHVLNVLDWIWTEFSVAGGTSFTDSIIEPLAGNPNSIKANGAAWLSVGRNFGLLASNMVTNAGKLATHHWVGDAADAFLDFLSQYWQQGAAWAGEKLGEFVAKGFDKIAEVSLYLAELAIDAINTILKVAAKIAAKFIPVVGWAWSAIEYAAKGASWLPGVDIDIDALHDNIMEIIDLAEKVFSLYESITQLVETMQDYFSTVQDLLDTVNQIPEIGSLEDAASTLETINEHKGQLQEQTAELESNVSDAEGKLNDLDEIKTEAGA